MNDDEITPEDELKAENEILKLRLEMEHGMQSMQSMESMDSNLPPEIENQWLNNIMNFEQQHKNAKRISVYEFIGKPEFKKASELNKESVAEELERLLTILDQNEIELSSISEYDDELIYKFITEELFLQETDDIRIEGIISCFDYEEFHPNHQNDLDRYTREYIEDIFGMKWHSEYSVTMMEDEIKLNGKKMLKKIFSEKVELFHELHQSISVSDLAINKIDFSIEKEKAKVEAHFEYEVQQSDGEKQNHKTNCTFQYVYKWDCWCPKEITFDNFNL